MLEDSATLYHIEHRRSGYMAESYAGPADREPIRIDDHYATRASLLRPSLEVASSTAVPTDRQASGELEAILVDHPIKEIDS
jgi:hypothetical protein